MREFHVKYHETNDTPSRCVVAVDLTLFFLISSFFITYYTKIQGFTYFVYILYKNTEICIIRLYVIRKIQSEVQCATSSKTS